MDKPGGSSPETIAKVPPELLLVMMNPSYACPTLAPGRTHTPLTRVPPLLLGEQTSVTAGCAATAMLQAREPVAPCGLVPTTEKTKGPGEEATPHTTVPDPDCGSTA